MPPTPPLPTKPDAERLMKLRSAVVDAPLEQFDMGAWICDTTSCAAGWYVRANPDCGLILVPTPREPGLILRANQSDPSEAASTLLAEHFGIRQQDAYSLFVAWEYNMSEIDALSPAKQRESFLENLDALLARHGIAPAAGTAAEGAAQ